MKLKTLMTLMAMLFGGACLWIAWQTWQAEASSAPPTIEKVRELAQLVTLRVPVSEVRSESLRGYLGSNTLTLEAHGDALIGTDLDQAQFEDIDHATNMSCCRCPGQLALSHFCPSVQ